MGIHLVPLTEELLAVAIAQDRDTGIPGQALAAWAMKGPCMACLDGDALIAAGGVVPAWAGLAEAWALVSQTARRRQIAGAVRLCRLWLDALQGDARFRRLEFRVRWDAGWRQCFARALGANEGPHLLRHWGCEGADYAFYARLGGA